MAVARGRGEIGWKTCRPCLVDVGLDCVLPVAVAPHVALGRVRVDKVLHLVPVRPRLLAAPPPPKLPSIALRPFFVPASNDRTEISFWAFRRFLPSIRARKIHDSLNRLMIQNHGFADFESYFESCYF